MNSPSPNLSWMNSLLGRRGFLGGSMTAMAGIGLLDLLQRDGLGLEPGSSSESGWRAGTGQTHFPAKAKRVLQIFCPGAASHLDLWDYKPELFAQSGKPLPGEENFSSFQGKKRQFDGSPLGIRSHRTEWEADYFAVAAHGKTCRRYHVHPFDDVKDEHARPWLRLDEYGAMFRKGFPLPAPGSATHWVPQTTIYPRMWPCPTFAENRPTARRIGAMAICPRVIRPSRWPRILKFAI